VVADRADHHPWSHGPERIGHPKEAVADGEQQQRAEGEAREREPEEERGQEDQEETGNLADGGDVAELRPFEAEHFLEVVRDDVLVGRQREPETEGGEGKEDGSSSNRGGTPAFLGDGRRWRGV